jgi:superfamily II DNA or RNA helicase
MGRQVIVLLPKALQDNFKEEIIKFVPRFKRPEEYWDLSEREKRKIDKGIDSKIAKFYSFVSSNSAVAAQKLTEITSISNVDENALGAFLQKVNSLDNKLLIIDEVHNLLVNMINADTKNGSRIYDMIMNAKNLRLLFLSGSPIVGNPFELAVMFNMLRGYITIPGSKEKFTAFPDYKEFWDYFIDRETNKIKNVEIFKERIVGLVSFYSGAKDETRSILPFRHKPIVEQIPMSDWQWKKYVQARLTEIDEERKLRFSKQEFKKTFMKKPGRSGQTTFRVQTRQISNFALPLNIEKPKLKRKETPGVIESANKKILEQLTKKELTDDLKKYSPKMKAMYDKINSLKGNMFVYSQFISLEGIGIFAKILEAHGYTNYNKSKKYGTDYKTFAIFAGTTSDDLRKTIIRKFNESDNKNGKYLRILLATATAAEGVSLKNVRAVFILEPFWNLSRIHQVIGRAIRINSHKDLPKEDRNVESFVYLSVPPKDANIKKALDEKYTTDEYLFLGAKKKQELVDQFLKAMREVAIDCQANYAHNKDQITECYTCVPNNKPLWPTRIEDHLIPGNRTCSNDKIIAPELDDIIIDGKKYKKDDEGNIYELVPGKKNVFIFSPELTRNYKKK